MRIGEIAKVKGGKRLPKDKQLLSSPTKHPYIKIKDMYQNRELEITNDFEYIDEETYERIAKYTVCSGDVIIAIVGNTIGLVSLIGDSLDGANLTENCVKLVDVKGYLNKYIYYYLISPMGQAQIHAGIVGSSQPKLPIYNVEKIELPDVSLDEQLRIVGILDSIDCKIDNNTYLNQNLAEQIETLLIAFIDDEDTTPVKLGDYLYIKGRIGWKGLKKNEYLTQSEYRIINGESLTKSGIDWNKAGYISKERYDESPEIMLNIGDILLSKDGTIGKIGYVDALELPTSVASGIFVIRNNKPDIISTTFIYYLLKSKVFEAFIAARTEGSVIPHLYQKDFMEFEFPLPNKEKMARFEEITESMFSQIVTNLNENKKLATMRDSLLPKLMSGELDVSEIEI